MKKTYKVGDTVVARVKRASSKNIGVLKIKGKIKAIKGTGALMTYVVTGGIAEDFLTRNIK